MSQEQSGEVQIRNVPAAQSNSTLETIMEIGGGIARFGFSLFTLPLALLPPVSRQHMRNATRELLYAFATLPRDFAEIAGAEIEQWACEADSDVDVPAVPRSTSVSPKASPEPVQQVRLSVAEEDTPLLERSVPVTPESPIGAALLGAEAPSEPPAILPLAVGVKITYIEYDPPGSDVAGEFVRIHNSSAAPVDLTGWTLRDLRGHTFLFPAFTLLAGAALQVWTGSGSDDAANLYWRRNRAAWNNTGDTALLIDANGNEIDRYSYTVP